MTFIAGTKPSFFPWLKSISPMVKSAPTTGASMPVYGTVDLSIGSKNDEKQEEVKMNENLFHIKAAIAAGCTALGAFLGWKGVMLVTWVVAMALDYLTGTFAAMKAGDWSSARAREGLWHKGGMIFVVMVAGITDIIMIMIAQNIPIGIQWPVIVLPLVLSWYIITELGSVLENCVKMGAPVPGWLIKLLKASTKAVDTAGEKAADREGEGV